MTPIATQILDLVGSRLANIKIENGYFNTLIKLERARLQPFKNQDMPSINYYSTGDSLVKPLNTSVSERTVEVMVEFYTTTRDRVFTDLANELSTDVMIAIERDPVSPNVSDTLSPRLGFKVMRVEVPSITPVIGEGQKPYAGCVLNISITYRVDKNDPFVMLD